MIIALCLAAFFYVMGAFLVTLLGLIISEINGDTLVFDLRACGMIALWPVTVPVAIIATLFKPLRIHP
jgi:hypothetical protein